MGDKLAQDALDYLNQIRQKPTLAIEPLQERIKLFKGKIYNQPGQVALQTNEGTDVINELISFLKTQKPLQTLKWDDGLAQAARDHANDIGPKGITGHDGSDGSSMTDRIERYGEWMGHVGENISFGQKTGQDIILQLITDDGVKTRGHRKNCFSDQFKLCGGASADHKQYKTTCVFDLAEEFTPIGGQKGGKAAPAAKNQQAKPQQQQQQQKQPQKGQEQAEEPIGEIEQEAFEYLNQIRQNPKLAIDPLKERLKYFKGKVLTVPGSSVHMQTHEGPDVINECIDFLKTCKPLHPLQWDDGLTKAARDHADDIGPKGIAGHDGSDGSSMTDRIERYGEWMGHVGENISFGQTNGKDVILQLITDDGVKTRGHRKNCFSSSYKLVGIAAQEHKVYKETCVFDFSEEFTPAGQKKGAVASPAKGGARNQPGSSGKKNPHIIDEDDMDKARPPGCVSVQTSTETVVKGGKKHVKVTKTFKMKDGSSQVQVEETVIG